MNIIYNMQGVIKIYNCFQGASVFVLWIVRVKAQHEGKKKKKKGNKTPNPKTVHRDYILRLIRIRS